MPERIHPELEQYAEGTIGRKLFLRRYGKAALLAEGRDVLDCPCGVGWGTSMLTGARSLMGVDICGDAIDYAKRRYPGIEFITGDMRSMCFGRRFDLIICTEGIEHVVKEDAAQTMENMAAHLAPGGLVYFTVPLGERKNENRYHLHKYTEREFLELVNRFFDVKEWAVVPTRKRRGICDCVAKGRNLI